MSGSPVGVPLVSPRILIIIAAVTLVIAAAITLVVFYVITKAHGGDVGVRDIAKPGELIAGERPLRYCEDEADAADGMCGVILPHLQVSAVILDEDMTRGIVHVKIAGRRYYAFAEYAYINCGGHMIPVASDEMCMGSFVTVP